jgi:chromosome segregation ATPase
MHESETSAGTDQQANLAMSRADRERSLDALHLLELHAERGGRGREHEWLAGVRAALTTLERALGQQQRNAAPDVSLLSTIERDQSQLQRRVQELRQRYRVIHDEVDALSEQLDATDKTDTIDVTHIRQNLERLANELRYQRARETDIVYEAYSVDLGEGD